MKAFLVRLGAHFAANKTTGAIGLLVLCSVLVEAFPQSIAFLPMGLQDAIAKLAYYVIDAAVGCIYLFLRAHKFVPEKAAEDGDGALREGLVKKGGVNSAPTNPRPPAPSAQSPAPQP